MSKARRAIRLNSRLLPAILRIASKSTPNVMFLSTMACSTSDSMFAPIKKIPRPRGYIRRYGRGFRRARDGARQTGRIRDTAPSAAGREDFSRPFDLDQAGRASMRQDAMPLDTTRRLALVLSFRLAGRSGAERYLPHSSRLGAAATALHPNGGHYD